MLKKSITYTDYNGVERTEDFYFNLTQTEIAEIEMSIPGGLVNRVAMITNSGDGGAIMMLFKNLILKAYGQKSADGRRFEKSEDLSTAFSQTPAYDVLFMSLITNPENASAFFNGVIPKVEVLPTPPKTD